MGKADVVVGIARALNIPTRMHQDAIRYACGKHFSISCQPVCGDVHNKLHRSPSVQFVESRTELLSFNNVSVHCMTTVSK